MTSCAYELNLAIKFTKAQISSDIETKVAPHNHPDNGWYHYEVWVNKKCEFKSQPFRLTTQDTTLGDLPTTTPSKLSESHSDSDNGGFFYM